MKLLVAIALLLIVGLGCRTSQVVATKKSDLEISASIITNSVDGPFCVLRLTNRGEKPETVLTENPLESWSSFNGRRSPTIDLNYDFYLGSMGSSTSKEVWFHVPSLPKLGPVTLRKNETAGVVKKLDKDFMEAIQKPETVVRIRYSIGTNIAERFGLWHGVVETNETAKTLFSR